MARKRKIRTARPRAGNRELTDKVAAERHTHLSAKGTEILEAATGGNSAETLQLSGVGRTKAPDAPGRRRQREQRGKSWLNVRCSLAGSHPGEGSLLKQSHTRTGPKVGSMLRKQASKCSDQTRA